MADLFDNPIGLTGFEFVEFCAPEKGCSSRCSRRWASSRVARHRSKDVALWRQGGINLIANYEPQERGRRTSPPSTARRPAAWRSACSDAHKAYAELLERGAEPVEVADRADGAAPARDPRASAARSLYLIDRYESDGKGPVDLRHRLRISRRAPTGIPRAPASSRIDHLTHNVYGGRMEYWADYYEKLFNFREIRYFDIKGEYTGLTSKALTAPDGKIRIPLNEEGKGGGGQIEEFLRDFNGEGIQHIALICDDLLDDRGTGSSSSACRS